MKERQLNDLMLAAFPELTQAFGEYTSWQDGPDTGRFLTYEDLLPPIARRALEEGDDETAVRVAAFVEELLGLGDGYAENVATVTLLEGRRRAMARARDAISASAGCSPSTSCGGGQQTGTTKWKGSPQIIARPPMLSSRIPAAPPGRPCRALPVR